MFSRHKNCQVDANKRCVNHNKNFDQKSKLVSGDSDDVENPSLRVLMPFLNRLLTKLDKTGEHNTFTYIVTSEDCLLLNFVVNVVLEVGCLKVLGNLRALVERH